MRRFVMLAATAAALLVGPAFAEDRAVAVVERNYEKFGNVPAPDAESLFAALRQAGMRVASGVDLPGRELRMAVDDLSRPDPQPGARIVVLTGKFVKSDADTWLLATDAVTPSLVTADLHGVRLSTVVELLRDGGNRSVLLLGDASGGLEPEARLQNGIGTIAAGGGAHVIAGPPQSVARAATALSRPGTTVASVMREDSALRLLQGGGGEVAPVGTHPVVVGSPPRRPVVVDPATGQPLEPGRVLEGEAEAWVIAAARHSIASYREFLDAFPSGRYADVARTRLGQLGGTVAPVVTPAPIDPRPAPPIVQKPPAVDSARLAELRLNLSRGERVEVQRQLTRSGYDTRGIDGIFGSGTRAALSRWQRDNGVAATGYVDPETLRRLKAAAGRGATLRPSPRQDTDAATRARAWQEVQKAPSAAAYNSFAERFPRTPVAAEARKRARWLNDNKAAAKREEALGLTKQTRVLIERRLSSAGLKVGKADGSFDSTDRQAIRAYQKSRDLDATGFVDEDTVMRLLADALVGR